MSVRTANGARTFRGRTFEGRRETNVAPVLPADGGGGGGGVQAQANDHVASRDHARRKYCESERPNDAHQKRRVEAIRDKVNAGVAKGKADSGGVLNPLHHRVA